MSLRHAPSPSALSASSTILDPHRQIVRLRLGFVLEEGACCPLRKLLSRAVRSGSTDFFSQEPSSSRFDPLHLEA